MGFLSRFEGKMEDTFEGAADRMSNSPISPVQIAKKAEKQMRREKMVGAGKQYAPTLYTVLVNPDDDQRLFGYYPTLAGETETYLAAKAADDGLVMDGQPLVRFIVDEGLKHGKFDVIAEAVAAPIIAQLRTEEMQRYGIESPAPAPGYGGANAAQPYGYRQQAPSAADARRANHPGVSAGEARGYAAGAYGAYDEPSSGRGTYNAPVQPGFGAPPTPAPAAMPAAYNDLDANFDQLDDFSGGHKPPLPYVPEDEIDYSVDYGEYTFNSQDFDDYRQNGPVPGTPVRNSVPLDRAAANSAAAAAGAVGMAAAGAAAAGARQAQPANVAANTVAFSAGAGGANAVPNQAAVRASLIDTTNNRTYSLATARLLMGRESKNDVVVNDINASRTHAELRLEPQGVWTITDLGSTNGTLLNGEEIATAPLYEGDLITIGMTNYLFTFTS